MALWIALVVNGGMFVAEGVSGLMSGSASLQADALDFFGDTANYAISLTVVGMALAWRARAAMLKGATMVAFGGWVVGVTLWGVNVAGAMAILAVQGGVQIVREARRELRRPAPRAPAFTVEVRTNRSTV